MKKTLAVLFAIGISTAFAASSYNVALSKPTTINGTELKPGDCKVQIQGDKVVIKQGKTTVETSATVESASQRFAVTLVGYDADNATRLHDIRLGGTNLKVLFGSDAKTDAVAGSR